MEKCVNTKQCSNCKVYKYLIHYEYSNLHNYYDEKDRA